MCVCVCAVDYEGMRTRRPQRERHKIHLDLCVPSRHRTTRASVGGQNEQEKSIAAPSVMGRSGSIRSPTPRAIARSAAAWLPSVTSAQEVSAPVAGSVRSRIVTWCDMGRARERKKERQKQRTRQRTRQRTSGGTIPEDRDREKFRGHSHGKTGRERERDGQRELGTTITV
eukprot:COSAG05_NODE_1300_length_5243_cov_15.420101_4_plen_171_part_00